MFQQYPGIMKAFEKTEKVKTGKASSWAIQATYSDTPLKPTTEECIELQCLKGEQVNEKTMWIGFCGIF